MNKLKKALSIIWIIVTFFVIYFLHEYFFNWFTIAGIKPNLFVIFILFIGLFAGKKIGAILGLIFGIYLDLLLGRAIGVSGIMLGLIGLLGEYFDKNFSKESRVTIMLMVIGSTIIYELGSYLFHIMSLGLNFEIWGFSKILLIEVIYNSILVIILYPLLQKAGYYLENTFKVKNILTRYF